MLTNSSKVLRRRKQNCLNFFQSVSQSVIQSVSQPASQPVRIQGPVSSTATHYDTVIIKSTMQSITFIALSRLKNVRFGASMVQSVQRLRYGLNCPGFESKRRRDTFLFSKTSSPAGGSSQPHSHWAPRAQPLVRELKHSPPYNTEVKNEWSWTSNPPIRLYDWWNFVATRIYRFSMKFRIAVEFSHTINRFREICALVTEP